METTSDPMAKARTTALSITHSQAVAQRTSGLPGNGQLRQSTDQERFAQRFSSGFGTATWNELLVALSNPLDETATPPTVMAGSINLLHELSQVVIATQSQLILSQTYTAWRDSVTSAASVVLHALGRIFDSEALTADEPSTESSKPTFSYVAESFIQLASSVAEIAAIQLANDPIVALNFVRNLEACNILLSLIGPSLASAIVKSSDLEAIDPNTACELLRILLPTCTQARTAWTRMMLSDESGEADSEVQDRSVFPEHARAMRSWQRIQLVLLELSIDPREVGMDRAEATISELVKCHAAASSLEEPSFWAGSPLGSSFAHAWSEYGFEERDQIETRMRAQGYLRNPLWSRNGEFITPGEWSVAEARVRLQLENEHNQKRIAEEKVESERSARYQAESDRDWERYRERLEPLQSQHATLVAGLDAWIHSTAQVLLAARSVRRPA